MVAEWGDRPGTIGLRMGICHEFGPTIQAGCDHPMVANRPDACTCLECGVVCHGKFAGCATVWARGPQRIHWRRPSDTAHDAEVAVASARRQVAIVPGGTPEVMAREQPALDDMASAVRRLVAEVGRLREDIDEQRAMLGRLPERIIAELLPGIAAQPDGTPDTHRASPEGAPVPGQGDPGGPSPWHDRAL
ncbi:MAG: hypothetical protein NVS3B12_31940 [Acidimicrobiales bacterium]